MWEASCIICSKVQAFLAVDKPDNVNIICDKCLGLMEKDEERSVKRIVRLEKELDEHKYSNEIYLS